MDRQVLSSNLIYNVRVGRKRTPRWPAAEEFVLNLVSVTYGVPREMLLQPKRGDAGVADARHLAMYLMNVMLQTSLTDIGLLFGRDRTTIRHACARIEDRRDEKAFEAEVLQLEDEINGWRQARQLGCGRQRRA